MTEIQSNPTQPLLKAGDSFPEVRKGPPPAAQAPARGKRSSRRKAHLQSSCLPFPLRGWFNRDAVLVLLVQQSHGFKKGISHDRQTLRTELIHRVLNGVMP